MTKEEIDREIRSANPWHPFESEEDFFTSLLAEPEDYADGLVDDPALAFDPMAVDAGNGWYAAPEADE